MILFKKILQKLLFKFSRTKGTMYYVGTNRFLHKVEEPISGFTRDYALTHNICSSKEAFKDNWSLSNRPYPWSFKRINKIYK